MKHKDIKPLREQLWKEQKGICPICECEIPLEDAALDHDHQTTLIRGVLCKRCNSLEGVFRSKWKRSGLFERQDFISVLKNLACYLEQEQHPYIHPSHVPKNPKLMKRSYNKLKKEIEGANRYLKNPIKIPPYPKSKRLTKRLKELFDQFGLIPEFYTK
jgi:hypothetical protein